VKLGVKISTKSQNRRENGIRCSILSSLELAYSTLWKQVIPFPLHHFDLFEFYFPSLLFGILTFSFLVHISALGGQERETRET